MSKLKINYARKLNYIIKLYVYTNRIFLKKTNTTLSLIFVRARVRFFETPFLFVNETSLCNTSSYKIYPSRNAYVRFTPSLAFFS